MIFDAPYITGALRTLIYAGTILAAGACLFAATFPQQAEAIRPALQRQILLGALLIAVVEPLRYAMFQLSIAGGDAGLAFSPDMVWMGLELPGGQAALMRIASIGLILVSGMWAVGRGSLSWVLGLGGSALAIGSYALEGHTAGSAQPWWMSLLLVIHVFAVHWWIGGLWPLASAARVLPGAELAAAVERFGRVAVALVAMLLVAGAIKLIWIVGWPLDPMNGYQQLFAAKILGVVAILALAARNKFRITPLLRIDAEAGADRLRSSIGLELAVALMLLVLTGLITSTAPGPAH